MRIFAATSPQDPSQRTAVPVEILRRLAFGRPQRQAIQPAMPATAARPAPAIDTLPAPLEEINDLDQRVRQSGEW